MIIARGTKNGREILILGLSTANIAKLVEQQPMHIRHETHPGVPEGWEIIICYGDENQLYADFKKVGIIGPETVVHKDPRLNL